MERESLFPCLQEPVTCLFRCPVSTRRIGLLPDFIREQVTYECVNQLTDFHETSYELHATMDTQPLYIMDF
jgi:hypothetical protein